MINVRVVDNKIELGQIRQIDKSKDLMISMIDTQEGVLSYVVIDVEGNVSKSVDVYLESFQRAVSKGLFPLKLLN